MISAERCGPPLSLQENRTRIGAVSKAGAAARTPAWPSREPFDTSWDASETRHVYCDAMLESAADAFNAQPQFGPLLTDTFERPDFFEAVLICAAEGHKRFPGRLRQRGGPFLPPRRQQTASHSAR